MLTVKVFISSKTNKKAYALVLKTATADHYLSFDKSIICDYLDVAPSMLMALDVGEYDGKGDALTYGDNHY